MKGVLTAVAILLYLGTAILWVVGAPLALLGLLLVVCGGVTVVWIVVAAFTDNPPGPKF